MAKQMYHKYQASIFSESFLEDKNEESKSTDILLEKDKINDGKPFFKWNNINVETKSTMIENVSFGDTKRRSYFISKRRKILNDVSGYAFQNTLTVIIGGSGCGKTTLLNVLTGNPQTGLKVSGSVTVNDEVVDMKLISGYVYQHDEFYSRLSVYEHLKYQGSLRLGKSYKEKELDDKINTLLEEFNLNHIKFSQIGHHGLKTTGISGGERKRLSIITELLVNPLILFLDEPTTGLDVYNAGVLVELLRNITKSGVTVICTVHQPSSQMISYFEYLNIISEGYSVYFGKTKNSLDFFKNQGFECPENTTPTDHFLRVVGKNRSDKSKSENVIKELSQENKLINNFPSNSTNSFRTGFMLALHGFFIGNIDMRDHFIRFGILLSRDFKLMYRDYYLFMFKILSTSVVAIVFATMYRKNPLNTFQILETAITYFIDVANISISFVISVLYTFPAVLQVYKREHRVGMYNTSAFLISKYLIDIPQIIIVSLVYTLLFNYVLLYYFDHQARAFALHWTVNLIVGLLSVAIGYFISAISNNATTAIAAGGPIVFLFLILGVFAIKTSEIPYYLRWFREISWIYYGSEAMTIVGFNGRELECNTLLCRKGQFLTHAKAINFLGFDSERLGLDIGILVGYTILMLIITYIFLVLRSFITEKLTITNN